MQVLKILAAHLLEISGLGDIIHNLFAELGKKGFCLEFDMHGCLLPLGSKQTMSLQLTANAEYVRRRGRERKSDSHKLLIVLHAVGR